VLGIFISAKMEIAISLLTPPPPHRLRMRPPPAPGSHPASDAAAMLPAAMNLAAP
jgi:hypothetical protein